MAAPARPAHCLVIRPKLDHLVEVQRFVGGVLERAAVPPEFLRQMRLVVDEAVTNAIDHGAANSGVGEVRVSCEVADGSFRLLVEDFHGRRFDPEYFQRIALARTWGRGGRGILLIHGLMDQVMYMIEEGRHTALFMEKRIPGDAGAEKR